VPPNLLLSFILVVYQNTVLSNVDIPGRGSIEPDNIPDKRDSSCTHTPRCGCLPMLTTNEDQDKGHKHSNQGKCDDILRECSTQRRRYFRELHVFAQQFIYGFRITSRTSHDSEEYQPFLHLHKIQTNFNLSRKTTNKSDFFSLRIDVAFLPTVRTNFYHSASRITFLPSFDTIYTYYVLS